MSPLRESTRGGRPWGLGRRCSPTFGTKLQTALQQGPTHVRLWPPPPGESTPRPGAGGSPTSADRELKRRLLTQRQEMGGVVSKGSFRHETTRSPSFLSTVTLTSILLSVENRDRELQVQVHHLPSGTVKGNSTLTARTGLPPAFKLQATSRCQQALVESEPGCPPAAGWTKQAAQEAKRLVQVHVARSQSFDCTADSPADCLRGPRPRAPPLAFPPVTS